jgi:hypothetical protein
MTNIQSIIGLFIVLVVILSMGLQFSFFKEGFNNNVSNKVNNSNKNNDNSIPVQSKKNNSIAKHNMLDETAPNY